MWSHLLDGIDTLSNGDIDRVVCASLDVEDLSDEMSVLCEKLREEIGSSSKFDVSSLKSDHAFVLAVEGEMRKKVEKAQKDAEAEKVEPVMRGKVRRKEDGQIGIEGKWAFSTAQMKEGKYNRFRFTSKGTDLVESSNNGVVIVKSGLHDYSGMFLLGEGEETRKVKETLKLEFRKEKEDHYVVSGTGENEFGKFTLDGIYVPSKKKMIVNKAYEVQQDDGDFEDDDSDGEADYVDGDDAVDDEGTLDEDGDLNGSEMADELAALKAEQEMSVEELRRKYGGGGNDGVENDAHPPTAQKVDETKKSVDVPTEEKKKKKKIIVKKIVKKVIKVKRKKKRKISDSTEESSKKAKIDEAQPSTTNTNA